MLHVQPAPAMRRQPLLAASVIAHLWWCQTRSRLAERARDERGDVYSGTIFVAICVVIAVVVGGILLVVFQDKAQSIDVDTPTGPAPIP